MNPLVGAVASTAEVFGDSDSLNVGSGTAVQFRRPGLRGDVLGYGWGVSAGSLKREAMRLVR